MDQVDGDHVEHHGHADNGRHRPRGERHGAGTVITSESRVERPVAKLTIQDVVAEIRTCESGRGQKIRRGR
jgi:hypothetical protein